uniref:Uncharacterized protein n=1 Tax=Anguilla anguilla TaxID=7936 RepID=A0A0E9SVF9_ANGAN
MYLCVLACTHANTHTHTHPHTTHTHAYACTRNIYRKCINLQ